MCVHACKIVCANRNELREMNSEIVELKFRIQKFSEQTRFVFHLSLHYLSPHMMS